MRKCRLIKFNWLATKLPRKWSDWNLNACLLTPNLIPCPLHTTSYISHSWKETQCQSESSLYITFFFLLILSTQWLNLGLIEYWDQAVFLWASDALILSLPWTCWVIMNRLWAFSLALGFSISRVRMTLIPLQEIVSVTGSHAYKGPCGSHRRQT